MVSASGFLHTLEEILTLRQSRRFEHQCVGWGRSPTRKWLFSLPSNRSVEMSRTLCSTPSISRENRRRHGVRENVQITDHTPKYLSYGFPRLNLWCFFLPPHLLHRSSLSPKLPKHVPFCGHTAPHDFPSALFFSLYAFFQT